MVQISQWLAHHNLEQLQSEMDANDIDLEVLFDLTDEELKELAPEGSIVGGIGSAAKAAIAMGGAVWQGLKMWQKIVAAAVPATSPSTTAAADFCLFFSLPQGPLATEPTSMPSYYTREICFGECFCFGGVGIWNSGVGVVLVSLRFRTRNCFILFSPSHAILKPTHAACHACCLLQGSAPYGVLIAGMSDSEGP